FSALEFYRGFLGSATLVDYLPDGGLLAIDEPDAVAATAREFEEQVEQLHTDLLERGEVPPGLARPFRAWSQIERKRACQVQIRFDPDTEGLPFVHAPKFGSRLDPFLGLLVERRHDLAVVVSQQAGRLAELLQEQ